MLHLIDVPGEGLQAVIQEPVNFFPACGFQSLESLGGGGGELQVAGL